jgi:two-component system chemotaxis response regulator CheY
MESLLVEDDATSRLVLVELLRPFGVVHEFDSGQPAVQAVRQALSAGALYDLICLDIMLPDMDGQQILKVIRDCEAEAGYPIGRGSKIVMVTALRDKTNVMTAFRGACDGYLPKPFDKQKLHEVLRGLGLLK